jgi:hypothetical protein
VEDETARVTRYHLTKAKQLLAQNKITEAETRLGLLDAIAPNNPEAATLRSKIAAIRAEEKRKADLEAEKEAARQKKVADLLAKGDAALRAKKLKDARSYYQQALAIDASNPQGKAAIDQIRSVEQKQQKKTQASRKEKDEIRKIYAAGVTKFEAGELGEAERLLSKVAATKGHPYQASAKTLIDEIHKKTSKKLQARIDEARKMLEADQVLPAYEELGKIVKQFPKRDDAAKLFMKSQVKMLEKAKAAYKEGLAQQQLAEDPAAALDKYQEVLKYAPDPKSEYNQKAQKKIHELQLSP